MMSLKALPNVQITPPLDGHGGFIVTMKNWYKYQVDSTHAERKKRARSRGEEKREEEREKPFLSKDDTPKWM